MSQSKYQHILAELTTQIESGQLPVSHKLPSIRQLSQTYSCSKDTVQRALMELRHRRLIYPIRKSGYYVLDRPQIQEQLSLPISEIDNLAYEDFRICLNETLIGRENYLFNYYHRQEGLKELLQSVHRLLTSSHIYSKPEQLVVTTGTQQALYILSQMAFPEGNTQILLEQPTYHRMNALVREQKLPYQTVDRTWEGLDFEKLEALFKTGQIKFFYTISRLHNPLGISYNEQDKKRLVDLAQRYQVYIVEDDYMADFDPKNQPPLHYYDTSHRVIYIRSFSAAIFPALRLAALVLPKPLLSTFLKAKQLIDYDTNLILQKALSLYIDNGMFDKNRLALQRHLRYHQEQNQQILTKSNLDLSYQLLNQQVIFQLKRKQEIYSLKKAGLKLDLLEDNYISKPSQDYLRVTGRKDLEALLKLLDKKKEGNE